MTELLGLPIAIPSSRPSPSTPSLEPGQPTSFPLPTFLSRTEPLPAAAQELSANVVNIQTKLVKAEFVGCVLSGTLRSMVSISSEAGTNAKDSVVA